MDELSGLLQKITDLPQGVIINLLKSVFIIVLLWILRLIVIRIVWYRTEKVKVRYNWKKTTNYILIILYILVLSNIWLSYFSNLSTFLGLVSAGLAIAMKDPLTDIAGWIFLLARKPFAVGDRIEIGKHAGDVIDIRMFQFTLMEIKNWIDAEQSTGRVIHISNGKVFLESIANYSKGFQYIWNELPIVVTFESNWKKAKSLLTDIALKHGEHQSEPAQRKIIDASKKFMINYSTLTPIVYTSVKDNGVLLTIRYLCEPQSRRDSEQSIWEDVLERFAQCKDIDFAYPTRRIYNNMDEGKPGARVSRE